VQLPEEQLHRAHQIRSHRGWFDAMQRLQSMMKAQLLIVDRFEGGFAVREQEDGTMVDLDMKFLPNGTKEGGVLKFENSVYAIDTDATLERARRIRQLMDELWKD
jgi:hypothetical protein